MGFSDLLWTIAIFFSGCLFAAGSTMITTRLRTARILFYAAPVPLIGADIAWAVTTVMGTLSRVTISGLLGGGLAVGLVFCSHWAAKEEQEQRAVFSPE